MHSLDLDYVPVLQFQCFSAVGDGMHLEVRGRPNGSALPLMTFRADETLGMQVVIHGATDVAFPLGELKRAISLAEAEGHSESFYDVGERPLGRP